MGVAGERSLCATQRLLGQGCRQPQVPHASQKHFFMCPGHQREDAIERFQSIQESYSVLSDPKKRTNYIEQEYTEVLNPKAFTESYWNRVLNA